MIRRVALALALLPGLAQAGPWQFSTPLQVTPVQGPGVFHHLESSGRRSLAVSGDRVAITWEDEHDGRPRVYVASKGLADPAFTTAPAVSGDGEAFEPGITALGAGQFVLAWEEDAAVWARRVDLSGGQAAFGEPLRLSDAAAGQVSVATDGEQVLATWSERGGRHRAVRMARLTPGEGLALTAGQPCVVDSAPPPADQLYPSVAATDAVTVIAWEDRRPGHTIIMASVAAADAGCAFAAPQRISEQPPGPKAPFGKGHGVSRVALASHGRARLLAAWADKRDFRHGYDIWGAALAADQGFGPNQRIQDDFGELSQQWHTALAGDPHGTVVAAWDDNREGHADIAISWLGPNGWSDDLLVPGASGPGEQQHPTVSFDEQGRLHLAWVQRDRPGGPTRLYYSVGTVGSTD